MLKIMTIILSSVLLNKYSTLEHEGNPINRLVQLNLFTALYNSET